MYFYKQTYSDPNENNFYSLLKIFRAFGIYRPKINYTYNYDVTN